MDQCAVVVKNLDMAITHGWEGDLPYETGGDCYAAKCNNRRKM